MHFSRRLRFSLTAFLILAALSGLSIASAQTDSLPAPQEVEYDLGFNCPVSSALDSTATILWVLMDNCHGNRFSLRGFNVADGSPVNDETHAFTDELSGLTDEYYIDSFTRPMGFTPDGLLDIRYYDIDKYDAFNLLISLDSNKPATTPSNESINTLLHSISEYPETTVYNLDHTRAAANGATGLHVLDLVAESELLEIPAEGESYFPFPSFSQDGSQLYVATLNNPDATEDYTSVLKVYSLPDGKLLNTYDVPSPFLWVSPDGQYAVALIKDEAFALIELGTGSISDPVQFFEGESRVTKCVNDGRDVSDVDYITSGKLPLMGLSWFPDSAGFMTVHSYFGESAGGAAPCYFNHSRLRSYTLP
jgi:hypothetical protein